MSAPQADTVRTTRGPAAALWRSGWRWLPLTAAVIVADQLSKAWIAAHFHPGHSVALLPVLSLILTYNTGAAFSFLAGASGWQRWVFTLLAVVVGVGLVVWLRRLDGRRQRLLACSLALILAGAIGNVIDRLRIGRVVDFILAHWHQHYFPAFNLADSSITIGAALLLLDAWLQSRRTRERH